MTPLESLLQNTALALAPVGAVGPIHLARGGVYLCSTASPTYAQKIAARYIRGGAISVAVMVGGVGYTGEFESLADLGAFIRRYLP